MQRLMRLMWPISPPRLSRLRPTKPTMQRPMKLKIEANVIDEIAVADEVIVIDKPAEAEEAKADEANEAKADEANAEADVANELTSQQGC